MKTTSKKHATSAEITVTLTQSDLEAARLKALGHLAGELKIAGFRKGKAPANVVEKHVDANTLAGDTLDIAVRSALPKAYEAEKIQPISTPQVEVTKYVPGESAEFVAKSDIMPAVQLGNYKKLKTKHQKIEVKPADVEDILGRLAKSFADKKVANKKAKLGDEVIIDFVGKKDDKAFDGGSAKDFALLLGSGQFIPGFEDGIVGHASGDKINIDLTFPKDYHSADLASAKVTFEVLVKQVNEIITPKIDDELAKKAGAFKTLKELKEDIKNNLTTQNDQRTTENYKDALIMELVGLSKVEAPETLVAEQAQFIREDFERNLTSRGTSLDQHLKSTKKTQKEFDAEVQKTATDRVKASLVLQALAEELDIKVTDKQVDQKLTELKEVYKKEPSALEQLESDRVKADIKNRLRVDQTLDALIAANQ